MMAFAARPPPLTDEVRVDGIVVQSYAQGLYTSSAELLIGSPVELLYRRCGGGGGRGEVARLFGRDSIHDETAFCVLAARFLCAQRNSHGAAVLKFATLRCYKDDGGDLQRGTGVFVATPGAEAQQEKYPWKALVERMSTNVLP
jgi:hypothetical protein